MVPLEFPSGLERMKRTSARISRSVRRIGFPRSAAFRVGA
jgi:hypothetical protein